MKKFIYFCAMAIVAMTVSCQPTEPAGPEKSADNAIKNIAAYAESAERGQDVLEISYNARLDTICLTTHALPETATPVDVTKIHIDITVAKTATVNISANTALDLTDPKKTEIKITAENGDVRSYGVALIITPAYEVVPEFETVFTSQWTKSGTEMGLVCPASARGICVAGDYFLVLDNQVDYNENAKIKAYDKTTGAFVKDVACYEGGWTAPSSYMWSIASDDAGNFAIGRLNSGGAGCRVDYYTSLDAVPVSIITYAQANPSNMQDCLGKRMQILGNIASGNSMILMTAAHFYGSVGSLGTYGTWTLTDGVPADYLPQMTTTAYEWFSATVQRASIDDPTMYIAYNDETGYPNAPQDSWDSMHAAQFIISTPGETPVAMKQDCMLYRITDMKVFDVLGGRFLATLQQTYSTAGEHKTLIYNITDDAKVQNAVPTDADYDKFNIYQSDGLYVTNDQRFGSVAVDVNETAGEAYIYTFTPKGIYGEDTVDAKISCVKMSVRRTN